MATGTPLLEAQQPHTDHSDDVPAEHGQSRHCGVASNMPEQKQLETTQYGESRAGFRGVSIHVTIHVTLHVTIHVTIHVTDVS